jgi:signal peptidase
MDVVAVTLFPSIIANLLYHYLTKRYGMYPNMVYRLLITLYVYLIPYIPNVPNVIFAFANIFVPILIFLFIDSLYEKKVRYALQRKSKLTVPITVIALAIMIFVVMVISNQFFIGTYVIATESMTGELNKGDAAIYERYDDQTITEGQVIAFEKNGIVVIHRVVDIQIINGQTRYFTKGDANEGLDSGFIFDSNIIGLINFKLHYIGYPTLWLRSLFSR